MNISRTTYSAVARKKRGTSRAATWLGVVLLGAFVLLALIGLLHPSDPNSLSALGAEAPSWKYPFGTDLLGRDLFVRVSAGAWMSLLVSVGSVLFGLAFAVPIGVYTAWRHERWPDQILMRVVEMTQIVPQFILAIIVLGIVATGDIAFFGVKISMTTRLIFCIGLGFIPFFTRVTRSAALVEIEKEYVESLRLIGVPNREVLLREVLPNIAPVIAIQALLAFAIAVFAEGGLSYLGLGVPPPEPTLGNLISEAGSQLVDGAWWYALIPGAVLVAGITGGNLLADNLTSRGTHASVVDNPTDPLISNYTSTEAALNQDEKLPL